MKRALLFGVYIRTPDFLGTPISISGAGMIIVFMGPHPHNNPVKPIQVEF